MHKSLTYWIDNKIIFLKVEGDYSTIEFLEVLKKALNNSAVPYNIAIVIDARLSEVEHKFSDIQVIHAELKKWTDRIACVAVVVKSLDFFIALKLEVVMINNVYELYST